jgi:subtilisin family serine protease
MPLTYYHAGRLREYRPEPLQGQPALPLAPRSVLGARGALHASRVHQDFLRASSIAPADRDWLSRLRTVGRLNQTLIWPTPALIVEGLNRASLASIRAKHGLRVNREGRCGRLLLRLPDAEPRDLRRVFAAARACIEHHQAHYAQPNFLKAPPRHLGRTSGIAQQWNLENDGTFGVRGADVEAVPAWQITQGDPRIRVAVLDEGVDSSHPALVKCIAAEHDASEGHESARPSPSDTHGTQCAGIIASRDAKVKGLAPEVSLVAVRIAHSSSPGGPWVFEDFKVSEGIDWAWQAGRADVLSNSWTDEQGSDSMSAAFERARTRGRSGRGTVVVCATGNTMGPVSYPATLPQVLAIAASNPWDRIKTQDSQDGETLWGSNLGPELDLVAPGVKIWTTLNRDLPGLDAAGPFTASFHGTSAAAPHVAAAAALVLSKDGSLSESAVRQHLIRAAHRIPGSGDIKEARRLDVHSALSSLAAAPRRPRASAPRRKPGKRKAHRR